MRLNSTSVLMLLALVGWGFLDSLFDRGPSAPAPEAVSAAITAELAAPGTRHPATAALYAGTPLWPAAAQRRATAALLAGVPRDGIDLAGVGAGDAVRAVAALDAAEARWARYDDAARDSTADVRPALAARADVALSSAVLRFGDALRGRRTSPAALYPGTWFPTVRDSANVAFGALEAAVRTGSAARVGRALDGLRPQQPGYRRLAARLAALRADLAPIPAGPTLAAGGRSVRVPHLRERLVAYGFLPADSLDAWQRTEPYLFDDSLATALGRFETARRLPVDRMLDSTATRLLNADPAELRARLALNLERWRWLPDAFGQDYIWVNIAAFELRVEHVEGDPSAGGRVETRLQMPVNVGSALTTGWTTPVIRDSVHTVEFQPAWYVPASLAGGLFAQARRDSLSLWRQGVDVSLNGRPVDSRLVQWDSVGIAGFRFVQRPGAANPLGRVKFLMHNPYAILIHDTNKRYTLADGVGSSMSSGCVQAGAPEKLAEALLTAVNGWAPGEAEAAYRRGPRRGVRLEHPFAAQFVYFTATAEADGALRTFSDPYRYDARLAQALGIELPEPAAPQAGDAQAADAPVPAVTRR